MDTAIPTLDDPNTVKVTKVNDSVLVNEATIIGSNIFASNGALHAVDTLLLPPGFTMDLEKLLLGYGASKFMEQLDKSGLAGILTGNETYTILAFTDEAWSKAPNDLTKNPSLWEGVMKTHLVKAAIPDLKKGDNHTTLNGRVITLTDAGIIVRGI